MIYKGMISEPRVDIFRMFWKSSRQRHGNRLYRGEKMRYQGTANVFGLRNWVNEAGFTELEKTRVRAVCGP